MIAILGESASGKTLLQSNLVNAGLGFHKLVYYTTRPIRDGEADGVDYHFVSENVFNELSELGFFLEQNIYNDWYYGAAKADCLHSDYTVAVLTPAGFRRLVKAGVDIKSIYLKVDRRSRLIQVLDRGDNIEEAYRRNLSDVGQFDGIGEEVDYVIDNTHYHMSAEQTLLCLKTILEEVGYEFKQ